MVPPAAAAELWVAAGAGGIGENIEEYGSYAGKCDWAKREARWKSLVLPSFPCVKIFHQALEK